jgi:RHS repeat-associated protein
MDLEVTPDENGNVKRREDHAAHRVETFAYDELYRLRHWSNTSGGVTVARELRYDPIGNLEQVLSGATVLEEFVDRGAAGPQQLDHSTGGVTYDYDHRGRQTRAGSRIITYNAFDLPRSVQDGSSGSLYEYTAAGDRFRRTDTLGTRETIYIDRLYERHKDVGSTQTTHVHHVVGPDGPVADVLVDAAGRRVSYVVGDVLGSTTVRFDETLAPSAAPERIHYEPFGTRIHADGSPWTGTWLESRIGFAGVEHDDQGLVNMGGRLYDPAQRRFLTPDPIVSDPYVDQAWHRYSYARNNPATLTDPTGYWIPPAWLCGNLGNIGPGGFSFGSYNVGGGPPPMLLAKNSVPDVTPDAYRGPTPESSPALFTGPGYAGGDRVARWLIDNGVDAWLQHNGDQAIAVSLGISYTALSIATFGAAAEAGVFVGASARVASFGARSWRTLTGVAGVIGEGARRYGNQLTQWGARMLRSATASIEGSNAAAPAARGEARLLGSLRGESRRG